MKFCSECAHPLEHKVPEGDNRLRDVCPQCGVIHYQNPKLVLGTIPVWELGDRVQIMLCRRAIEPRRGFWTLPAGFMENEETTEQAACRETLEEAGANIELQPLFSVLNVPHVHQVHMFYRARLLDLNYAAGTESLEVRMFDEDAIPWDELAFPTVMHTLEFFLADLRSVRQGGSFGLHSQAIYKPMRQA